MDSICGSLVSEATALPTHNNCPFRVAVATDIAIVVLPRMLLPRMLLPRMLLPRMLLPRMLLPGMFWPTAHLGTNAK